MKGIYILFFKEPSLTNAELIHKVITDDTKSVKIDGNEYYLQYTSCLLNGQDCYVFLKKYPLPLQIDNDEEFKNLLRLFPFEGFETTLEHIARSKLFTPSNIREKILYASLLIMTTALLTYVITIHFYGLVNLLNKTQLPLICGAVFQGFLKRRKTKITTKRQMLKSKQENKDILKSVFSTVNINDFGEQTKDDTENLNMVLRRVINTQYIKHPFIVSIAYQIPLIRNMINYALHYGLDDGLKLVKHLKEIISKYPRESMSSLFSQSPLLRG